MAIQPKGIILHSMSEYLMYEGQRLYAKDFLKKLGLSVHGFIKPDGTYDKMITTPSKAFHAGKSLHEGLSGLNSHYLGVELLVSGLNDYGSFTKKIKIPGTYTQAQFDQTVKVFKFWMDKFNIPANRVVRHSDVSGDHVRGKGKGKVDPGPALDWDKFQNALVT